MALFISAAKILRASIIAVVCTIEEFITYCMWHTQLVPWESLSHLYEQVYWSLGIKHMWRRMLHSFHFASKIVMSKIWCAWVATQMLLKLTLRRGDAKKLSFERHGCEYDTLWKCLCPLTIYRKHGEHDNFEQSMHDIWLSLNVCHVFSPAAELKKKSIILHC